jgi:dTMP kinase
MPRGVFITFEGGEGAGKTTQLQRLRARLEQSGKQVVTTREPGGSPGAEAIRKLLVEGDVNRWGPLTETMLHFAARRDHVEKVITPALNQGKWVLSDRFFDSTYAYQGYGQGLDKKAIDLLRRLSIGTLKPDLTFMLDLPADVGLKRAAAAQRYERMGLPFHEKLRQGFLQMAKKEPRRFVVIDAALDIETVTRLIGEAVEKRIPKKS